MSKHILFVASTGAWWDHRYYFKQMPALAEEGFNVSYMVQYDNEQNNINTSPISILPLTVNDAKKARLTGGISLLNKVRSLKLDAVQICNIELIPLGILIALFTSVKVFYDCREDHYHAMLHHKTWFPKIIRYLLGIGVKTIEYLAAKTYSGFIVSDPAIYFMHSAMPSNEKMIFYNMALKSQFVDKNTECIKDFHLAVLGSMSVRTGVLDVVTALGELKRQGKLVKLKLIGNPELDKALWEKIMGVIKEYDLNEQIRITGRLPYNEIPNALSDCQVGVIPLLRLPKFENNIATKQFEYMSMGMPVISTDLPPQRIFIHEGTNGFFYKAGSVEQLVNIISYFIDNPNEVLRMGANAKSKIIEGWNSEEQQIKYVDFYNKRLQNEKYYEEQLPENINEVLL